MLKARILDMYVMDLDRHEDQWLWGAVDKDKGKLYYPDCQVTGTRLFMLTRAYYPALQNGHGWCRNYRDSGRRQKILNASIWQHVTWIGSF